MSELKVNVISEVTGANGVVIDSTKLKDGGVIIADDGNIGSASDTDAIAIASNGVVTFSQATTFSGAITSNAGVVVDNITIDGTEIDLSSGDLTLDVAGDIILDADGGDVKINDGGTAIAELTNSSTDFVIKSVTNDKDIIFKGVDNSSAITALTLDMSAAGAATFNAGITATTGTFSSTLTANGGAVFNEDSADVDFRVETNGNANMMFISGGNDVVGIGAEGDLGVGLHIKSADSSASVDSASDELVIEGSGSAGMSILTGTSSEGGIKFGDSGDNDAGRVVYDHATDALFLMTSGTEGFRLDDAKLSTGGETAPDVNAGGITLDINANDDKFISFKSSDYAHGITDHLETDTGFAIAKSHASGGVSMTACNDGNNENIFNLTSIMGETNTTATNATAGGNFTFGVYRKADSGTGTQAVADAGNAWVMRNNNAARLVFKGDGEIHSDTGSTTFDAYEDAQLVRAFDLSHGVGVINSKFDKFISYNHEKLADLGLVGRDENGTPNHFTNITGMQKLHNGAIWQQYTKHNQLLEAVYELATESVGKEKADAILEKHEIKLLN